jgi:hypothetical protein
MECPEQANPWRQKIGEWLLGTWERGSNHLGSMGFTSGMLYYGCIILLTYLTSFNCVL